MDFTSWQDVHTQEKVFIMARCVSNPVKFGVNLEDITNLKEVRILSMRSKLLFNWDLE